MLLDRVFDGVALKLGAIGNRPTPVLEYLKVSAVGGQAVWQSEPPPPQPPDRPTPDCWL